MHFARGVRGWLLLLAALVATKAIAEALLFAVLGKLVDWLSERGGHVGPTLGMARKLRDRGDQVHYLIEPEMHELLTREGFGVTSYLDQWYPIGWTDDPKRTYEYETWNRLDLQWGALRTGWLSHTIESLEPDIILYDTFRMEAGLVAHQLGIPCARLSTSFPIGYDLFITHGGQSSFKESVWAGTPMLVCPQAYDQHGNAARVVYHGLGQRNLDDDISPEALGALIDDSLDNAQYTQRLAEMSAAFRDDAEANVTTDLDFIDAVMADEDRGSTAVRYTEAARMVEKNATGTDPKPRLGQWPGRKWSVSFPRKTK